MLVHLGDPRGCDIENFRNLLVGQFFEIVHLHNELIASRHRFENLHNLLDQLFLFDLRKGILLIALKLVVEREDIVDCGNTARLFDLLFLLLQNCGDIMIFRLHTVLIHILRDDFIDHFDQFSIGTTDNIERTQIIEHCPVHSCFSISPEGVVPIPVIASCKFDQLLGSDTDKVVELHGSGQPLLETVSHRLDSRQIPNGKLILITASLVVISFGHQYSAPFACIRRFTIL